MKPILYPDSETEFTNNGVGILTDAISCQVETELNGVYELEMTYPADGIHFADIQQRSIILAKPDPVSQAQPFRVYRITRPLGGTVRIYARHVAYDLIGHVAAPFSASYVAGALQAMKDNAVPACPFLFRTDKLTEANMTVSVPTAIWSLLGGTEGSILDTYGGEYEFDRWTVTLHSTRGENRGVSIRYGKNLTSLEQDENCADCYTGVWPYWVSLDGELVQLEDRVIHAEGSFGYVKILPLDFSQEWEEAPSTEQLRARAEHYISDNKIGVPAVSWEVSFVQLEQSAEYRDKAVLEQISLGDTVSVVFSKLGVDASARAIKTKYNVLLDRYESITLGSVKANIADTIVNQQQEISGKASQTALDKLIRADTSAMNSYISQQLAGILGVKGGAVRLLDTNDDGMPDELYLADDPDPEKASQVWRFNYLGWAASANGYDGPFVLGASLADGILADFITAGTLDAALITVKNLIADRVMSIQNDSYMEINESELGMAFKDITNLYIHQDFGFEGGADNQDGTPIHAIPVVHLRNIFPNEATGAWEVTDESVLTAWHLLMGSAPESPLFLLQCYDGVSHIEKLDKLLGKTIAWKYNSTVGAYVLTGT